MALSDQYSSQNNFSIFLLPTKTYILNPPCISPISSRLYLPSIVFQKTEYSGFVIKTLAYLNVNLCDFLAMWGNHKPSSSITDAVLKKNLIISTVLAVYILQCCSNFHIRQCGWNVIRCSWCSLRDIWFGKSTNRSWNLHTEAFCYKP
jgi:hypothetical protein